MRVEAIRIEFQPPLKLSQDDIVTIGWQLDYGELHLVDLAINGVKQDVAYAYQVSHDE